MAEYQSIFKRYEKKYKLTQAQYDALMGTIGDRMARDRFAVSTISNIYYDTPDYQLIRTSLGKPQYKEKLRLRCYRTPQADSEAFVEIKKKYAGVVYKRRIGMPYQQAVAYLEDETAAPQPTQITREVDWFKQYYSGLRGAMVISYDRLALYCREDPELRMTFDRDIRWRTEQIDLAKGDYGEPLLEPGTCLMEIKIAGAMPLWLSRVLAENEIFPTSYSKYGGAYQTLLERKGVHYCA